MEVNSIIYFLRRKPFSKERKTMRRMRKKMKELNKRMTRQTKEKTMTPKKMMRARQRNNRVPFLSLCN